MRRDTNTTLATRMEPWVKQVLEIKIISQTDINFWENPFCPFLEHRKVEDFHLNIELCTTVSMHQQRKKHLPEIATDF